MNRRLLLPLIALITLACGCTDTRDADPTPDAPETAAVAPERADFAETPTLTPRIWVEPNMVETTASNDTAEPTHTYVVRWKNGVLTGKVAVLSHENLEPQQLDVGDEGPSPVVINQMLRFDNGFPKIEASGRMVIRIYCLPTEDTSIVDCEVTVEGSSEWKYSLGEEGVAFSEKTRELPRCRGLIRVPKGTPFSSDVSGSSVRDHSFELKWDDSGSPVKVISLALDPIDSDAFKRDEP